MYLFTGALVIAGWLVVLISSRRMLKRTRAELRLEFERQIDSLAARVRALEQSAGANAAAVVPEKVHASAAASGAQEQVSATQASDEITPETLATIAETVTALLGRQVHVRSVKILETPNAIANPWAQHGRAVIQASHWLPRQGREK